MKHLQYILGLLLFTGVFTCKKNYTPAATASVTHFLVVEGVINAGADSTFIKLSRTVNISTGSTNSPVTKAKITVESDQNDVYALTEVKTGTYACAGLNLNKTKKYHLRIKTADGKEYTSDFESVNLTPAIDSVGFTVKTDGIQIYANTHDPNNTIHYYRWGYNETWLFHSEYTSTFMSDGTKIIPRTGANDIYTCFGNAASSSIVLGSSAKLAQDEIYQSPITTIASTSEKLETKYSIILYQYGLTTDEYNFWVNLQKNTEQLGSIFDAQPSTINGNVHNTNDATDVVIGYISVGFVQTKRIFITREQLPSSWTAEYPYKCHMDSLLYNSPGGSDQVAAVLIPLLPTSEIPLSAIITGNSKVGFSTAGYLGGAAACVDCTLRGTKTQPAFWK